MIKKAKCAMSFICDTIKQNIKSQIFPQELRKAFVSAYDVMKTVKFGGPCMHQLKKSFKQLNPCVRPPSYSLLRSCILDTGIWGKKVWGEHYRI